MPVDSSRAVFQAKDAKKTFKKRSSRPQKKQYIVLNADSAIVSLSSNPTRQESLNPGR
jgi:hypothetical protein